MRSGWIRATVGIVSLAGVMVLGAEAMRAADDSGKPDATIELKEASAALGVGWTWGAGTLVYKGKRYPFKMSGLSAGEVGGTKVSARGDVYHLKNVGDFNGRYTSTGAGATAGGGFDVEAMRNGKGVEIKMVSTTEGADLKAAIEGLDFTLEK